jgi:hypothetical protein
MVKVLPIAIPTGYFFLSFYVLGSLTLENDVNYSTWHLIGHEHFGGYHSRLEALLGVYLFFPMTLQLLFNGLLVWFGGTVIPRKWVTVTLLLNTYIVVESLLVQVPIHRALEKAFSADLLEQLIMTHRTYRLPAVILAGATNLYMLWNTVRKAIT